VGAVRTDLPLSKLTALLQGVKMAATSVLLPTDRAPSASEFEIFVRVHLDLVRRISERSSEQAEAIQPGDPLAPVRTQRSIEQTEPSIMTEAPSNDPHP
jgi:hypothetical protein